MQSSSEVDFVSAWQSLEVPCLLEASTEVYREDLIKIYQRLRSLLPKAVSLELRSLTNSHNPVNDQTPY